MKLKTLIIPVLLSAMLAACGGGAGVKPGEPAAGQPSPPPSGKPGGYYLDDGPGDNPPADIDAIPDAVPHPETPLARANRPYTALGTHYTPMMSYTPYKRRGVASWYGRRYHGQKTSSGEVYDMYNMTGAHTTLPLPSYVRVTNPANGRSVIVRINDRGPFHSDRLIDLSYAAAYKLRLTEKGRGLVEVEAIDSSRYADTAATAKPASSPSSPVTEPLPTSAAAAPGVEMTPLGNAAPPISAEPAPKEPAASQPLREKKLSMPAEPASKAPLAAASGTYVQVGAFKEKTNADRLVTLIQQKGLAKNVSVDSVYNAGYYRTRLGPYAGRQAAEQAAADIKQKLGTSAVLIQQK